MTALLLLSLTGCASGPFAAPYGSEIDLTNLDEASFAIDGSLLDPADQRGYLVRLEALVTIPGGKYYDEAVPGNNIKVEVMSGWSGAYLLPEEAVRVVDDYETECDNSGATQDPEDPCHAWFDNASSTFVEFAADYTDLEDFRPTYFSAATDSRGTLPFYVFIDSVPTDADGEPIDFSVYSSIEVADDWVTFDFGGGGGA